MSTVVTQEPAPPLHSPEWHAARRLGVGGSDIPVLAGLSPYGTGIHDIYLEKIGELEPRPSSPEMEVGSVIEDAIAILYQRRTGRKAIRANVIRRHRDHPWAIGNLDRVIVGERRLVEIKNRRAATRELPADVECQVQWYLGVTGYPVADVAMLVGGSDLRILEVKADASYFDDLLTIAGDFWSDVESRTPPAIDGSESAARYLAHRYPWHTSEVLLPANADVEKLALRLAAAKVARDDALSQVRLVENGIKALLGEAPGIEGADWKITWKKTADYSRTDWHGTAAALRPADDAEWEAAVREHSKRVDGPRQFRTYGLGTSEKEETP